MNDKDLLENFLKNKISVFPPRKTVPEAISGRSFLHLSAHAPSETLPNRTYIMKGQPRRPVRFLEGADKRFIIPVYQRNYDWKSENCAQLYNDLLNVVKGNKVNAFLRIHQ